MPKTPESIVKDRVVKHLEDRKIWHFVYPANSTFGLPDIIAIHKGFFLGIELKRADGKGRATLLQKATLNGIEKAGGFGVLVECVEDLKLKILEIDKLWKDLISVFQTVTEYIPAKVTWETK